MFIDVNAVDPEVRLGLPSLDDYDNGTVIAMDVDETGRPSDLYTLNEVTLHLQEHNIERELSKLEFDRDCDYNAQWNKSSKSWEETSWEVAA